MDAIVVNILGRKDGVVVDDVDDDSKAVCSVGGRLGVDVNSDIHASISESSLRRAAVAPNATVPFVSEEVSV